MRYTVIKLFTDLQDNNYLYNIGDTYPRDGYTPTQERIDELSGSANKQHTPLIKAVQEAVESVTEDNNEPVEDVTETKPKRGRRKLEE